MNDTVLRVCGRMHGVNRAQAKFLSGLLGVLTCFVGKATYRNLSRFSRYHEKTYSRWASKCFDFLSLNTNLLASELGTNRELIGVTDASFLKKSGKRTEGLGMFWNSCVSKAERGLEVSALGMVDVKSHTFYCLDAKQIIDGEDEDRLLSYELQVERCSQSLLQFGVKYLVTDGLYMKKTFTEKVLKQGFHQVCKLRCNADLYWPFEGNQKRGRGRPRKYKGKVLLGGDTQGWQFVATAEDDTQVFVARAYAKYCRRNIQAVLLRKEQRDGTFKHAYLYSTDLEMSPLLVVQYYRARFQIEFAFRDAKQHTGLQDCQARCAKKITQHLNASLTALNILKLEDRRDKGVDDKTVISIDSWKRRKMNNYLMDLIFNNLEVDQNCEKIRNIRQKLQDIGVIAA